MTNFFISSSWLHNIVQTTTHDDVFPLRRAELPSLTFNLVGRWLRSAKRVADTLPASGRASVYCCLPRQPCTSKLPAIFQREKYLNAPLPPHPPPLQFHHPPPSPGAPLNNIQRVRSRSRADIEGKTGGFKEYYFIIFLRRFADLITASHVPSSQSYGDRTDGTTTTTGCTDGRRTCLAAETVLAPPRRRASPSTAAASIGKMDGSGQCKEERRM
jgi:hypothetical protein